jgi:ATP-binding cassette subfamily B protein
MVKNSLFNLKIEEELPVLDYRLNRSGKRSRLSGILNTMTGFRLRFLFAVCAQVAATVCKTSVYLLLAWFIDTWLVGGDHSVPLFLVGFAFIGLSLVEGFSSFQANHQANYTAERVALRLRNNLYDQIQRLSFSYHDKVDTGDLIQRVTSDVDAVRRFFSEQAIGIGRIFFLYIINWVAIARIDLQLALTTMVIVPLIFVMALFFFSKISKSYEAYQVQDAQLSSLLQENLTGVRVVKAFARQDYEIEKYRRENEKKYKLGSKLILIESLFWPSTDMLCGMQIVISFYLGASAAIAGRITLGEFIAFQALLNWVIWPIRNMGRLIVQMSRSLVSFERVNTVLAEQQEELRQGEKAPEPFLSKQITFDNVSFSYDEKNKVLDEVSFTAEAGHTIALLGSTGSGKSSLLALIPRFYEYQSGSIQLDGMELNQIRKEDLRRNIGIV